MAGSIFLHELDGVIDGEDDTLAVGCYAGLMGDRLHAMVFFSDLQLPSAGMSMGTESPVSWAMRPFRAGTREVIWRSISTDTPP